MLIRRYTRKPCCHEGTTPSRVSSFFTKD